MPAMNMPTSNTPTSSEAGGMGDMPMNAGSGLHASHNGYTLTMHGTPMAGMSMPTTFTITKAGRPVTAFDPEQTKRMHYYLIRSDLTGFQHLHPVMSPGGTWTVSPSALTPGSYRAYAQFVPRAGAKAGALVLSRAFTVPGTASTIAIPGPRNGTTVDGYTLRLAGTVRARSESPLTIILIKDGAPVTDLQPYLETYAHVTAIHAGDLAFAHLHPAGGMATRHGGPALTLQADLPEPGHYRAFIQFQTRGGQLHTAAVTINAA